MKWCIPALWIASILYAHLRGRVRMPLGRALLDYSVILAPINAFMVLASRVPTTPYLTSREFPELKTLEDNWETIRDEALHMAELRHIKAAEKNNDIGFNSFFKYGWKRFYLKWYDVHHPSAQALCPRTVALLESIPAIKAAMFAELPPGSQLNPHRDPYAGSLRYHLGLATPNDEGCHIDVDGQRYSWRDGRSIVFDETYVHSAANETGVDRIILFCDVERPMRYRWTQAVNHWFGRHLVGAAASPNDAGDRTGGLNRVFKYIYSIRIVGKRLKAWNRYVYYAVKWALFGGILLWILW